MNRFDAIRAAVAVSQSGSFVAAAHELGIAQANVTRHVKALEAHLGCPLFERTTRNVKVTAAGARFLSASARILDALRDAEATVRNEGPALSGTMRILAPPLLTASLLPEAVSGLLDRHAGLQVIVETTADFVDPEQVGADVAFTVGTPASAASRCQRLATASLVLCASPAYLQSHDRPRTPDELAEHRLLHCGRAATDLSWAMRGGIGHAPLPVAPVLCSVDLNVVIAAARRGAGIALVPRFSVAPDLADGTMLSMLDGFEPKPLEICAVYPASGLSRTRLAGLVDDFRKRLG